MHHDALEFSDAKIVMVSRLKEGQRATVIQMPVGKDAKHVNTETGVVTTAQDGGTVLTTRELVHALRPFHPLWVMTHFNHPKECTREAFENAARIVAARWTLRANGPCASL